MSIKSNFIKFVAIISLTAQIATAAETSVTKPIKIASVKASDVYKEKYKAENAIDGKISDDSRWLGKEKNGELWLELHFPKKKGVAGIHVYSGYKDYDAIRDFYVEFKNGKGEWIKIPSASVTGNNKTALGLEFDATIDVWTDTLRLVITGTPQKVARVKEIIVWPTSGLRIPEVPSDEPKAHIPKVYLNQSGFNLNKPKRFTAPDVADGTPFEVVNKRTGKTEFNGTVSGHLGDLSEFNPDSQDEFVVKVAKHTSFPFRIGMWWLERVTYENAVAFMAESRHYLGDYTGKCRGSYGWRDDHHFGWELTTLVPQLLSNPWAYERMPHNVKYSKKEGFNGTLKPYKDDVPDIIKLIHFGADVIITGNLKHAFFKEQLAFFLYAWPALKQWLPEQNYQVVRDYTFNSWGSDKATEKYPYEQRNTYDLFEIFTKVGTTKGENPPGHSVMPNLLMYEVAKRENRKDAEKFFQAAYNQVDWMIRNLDWNDPLTTKGQRVSEHITMPGLALMLRDYPNRAPKGLRKKIEDWKKVAISRSGNMWDFRKLSDKQWVPTGEHVVMWNEPGNVLGFAACALSAITATPDSPLNKRLTEVVYAQMDNAFGRNPTGRHFSYDAPKEIEGCDVGWYSYHHSGIGHLPKVRFVFDGALKNEHYPYHPEVGNVGWTEGWIQFNTAFNISLAYMAFADTELKASRQGNKLKIRLKAPLNFDYNKVEAAMINMKTTGKTARVKLIEESKNSAYFSAEIDAPEGIIEVSYGYGYLGHRVEIPAIK